MTVGIIGEGRFGTLLKKLLATHFTVSTCETTLSEQVLNAESIFISVPIRQFESVLTQLAPRLRPRTTVLDVCSVKLIPSKLMLQYLPNDVDIIATHPLFGPDSFNTAHQKTIMLAKLRDQFGRYTLWKSFFEQHNIAPIEMSPEEHDQLMARTQNITHLIGRALKAIDAQPTLINTVGYTQLLAIMAQTCNDSLALFQDMQHFNPYSQKITQDFIQALIKLTDSQ